MNAWQSRTGMVVALALAACLAIAGSARAALVISSTEGGLDTFSAATNDVINLGTPTLSGQSHVGGSLYSSDPTGAGLNNGTIYAGGGYHQTENGRTYCPANGSSITFDLASPQDIYTVVSVSGGEQPRRSQRFRLEVSTVGDPAFTTVADESQIHFVSNAGNGEMKVNIADDLNAPIGTGVDQIRVTYFDTGASLPQSMYRELDVFNAPPPPPPPPFLGITSANLTYHIDADDMHNDGGATNPGDGNNISDWKELTTGTSLNIQDTPSWHATGLSGGPSVRFVDAENDLVFSNNAPIDNVQAQTIIAVAVMTADGHVLSDLVSNSSGLSNIRQTDSETAAYYPGNSGDFHFGGGSFTINGNPTSVIPGGFGAAHVVRSVSPSPININSLRIGDNANYRRWSGDVAEILVFDGVLNGNDSARVNKYIIDKYGINQVIDEPLSDTTQVADDPFADGGLRQIGVNFYYAPDGDTSGTLHGIAFDNINLAGATPPTGPFTLTANSETAALQLSFPGFLGDNGPRFQNVGASGPDAATLNQVGGEMFYVGGWHPEVGMTFSDLDPLRELYVQVFGGDSDSTWNGDLEILSNGSLVGDWTTVADGSYNNASLFGFFTTADALGQLQLDFSISAGNYAGIAGVIITQRVPEPGTFLLLALGGLALVPLVRRRRRRK